MEFLISLGLPGGHGSSDPKAVGALDETDSFVFNTKMGSDAISSSFPWGRRG